MRCLYCWWFNCCTFSCIDECCCWSQDVLDWFHFISFQFFFFIFFFISFFFIFFLLLIEPSDSVGGQLTNEALSAIDFAWAKVTTGNDTLNIPAIERDPRNLPAALNELVSAMGDP